MRDLSGIYCERSLDTMSREEELNDYARMRASGWFTGLWNWLAVFIKYTRTPHYRVYRGRGGKGWSAKEMLDASITPHRFSPISPSLTAEQCSSATVQTDRIQREASVNIPEDGPYPTRFIQWLKDIFLVYIG